MTWDLQTTKEHMFPLFLAPFFFTDDMGVMRRLNGQAFFHFLTDDMGTSEPIYT